MINNARKFKSLNINRAAEHDFRDDGTRFTGYDYKGLILTYTFWDGTMFLALRPDYDNELNYHDYADKDWYKICDLYNGVSSIDEVELVENLEKVVAGIAALKAEIASNNHDFTDFDEAAREEMKRTESFIENFGKKFDWVNRPHNEVYVATRYIKYVKEFRDRLEKLLNDKKNWQNNADRYVYNSYKKNGYIAFNPDNYFVQELYKLITK